MAPPRLCDVYFWSEVTGLLAFPGGLFFADAKLDHHGPTSCPAFAEPVLRLTTDDRPHLPLDGSALGAYGLLWTTSAEDFRFPEIIPSRICMVRCAPRPVDGNRYLWETEIHWRATGPFVVKGFSEPRLVEPK